MSPNRNSRKTPGGPGPASRRGNFDIFVTNADGSSPVDLTSYSGYDEYPTWSPDSTKITFHSGRHGGTHVWIMNTDASDQSNLTHLSPTGYASFTR